MGFFGILALIFSICVYRESRSPCFGRSSDPIPSKRLKHPCCSTINTTGLAELKAYGSGLIDFPSFKQLFKGKMEKVYVINLLNSEPYYYQDRCLRWYGMGFSDDDLGQLFFSHKPLKRTYKGLIRTVFGTPPIHDPSQLQTEEKIVRELGGTYYLPLKNNPGWLGNQTFMEDLIRFFELLPRDAHLYVHCFHGRGRTTIFLVLYDVFRNSKSVSLEDISLRHYCLGRENVLDNEHWIDGSWTQEALDARQDLIQRFYTYMNDPKGYGVQTWTQWNQEKKIRHVAIEVHRKENVESARP
jgi:hypothetical protein